jgi:cyclic pyranopterin phosphate synthase
MNSAILNFLKLRRITPVLLDRWQRPLGHLRISVTDRCNLRCAYCMPEPDYVWLPKATVLTFEELTRLTRIFAGLGVRHVRLTGGEPLLRAQVAELTAQIAGLGVLDDLAMTTNGVLLAPQAKRLRDAGLRRITVSLDTLQRDRFEALTRRDHLAEVLAGIDEAVDTFGTVKIDTVLMGGVNDDEVEALVAFAGARNAEIRFIEYMDVPGATHWTPAKVVSREAILRRVERALGTVETLPPDGPAPASRFRLASGQTFGIIASTTTPFCATCDRIRLTADGHLFFCLYATRGLDIRTPLRDGASNEDLAAIIASAWRQRTDRGAEVRLTAPDRSAFIAVEDLRRAPHLEMHTRGG